MILISSSAYVVNEFQAELGKIPPCFLPIGNKKLLEHQVNHLRDFFLNEDIYVSFPESYKLSLSEKNLINKLNIHPIFIPDDFSLAESINFAVQTNCFKDSEIIRVLYGDTLVADYSGVIDSTDLLGVSTSFDGYDWEFEVIGDKSFIWCGFFAFSSKSLLMKCLALKRQNFIDAIKLYRSEIDLIIHNFGSWYDLGHVNTYFRSRALITTQRAFNELKISEGVVCKSGNPIIKIQAEAYWFQNIPHELKIHVPQFIKSINDKDNFSYCLEYLPCMPLNELYVHSKKGKQEWKSIFELLEKYLEKSRLSFHGCSEQIDENFQELISKKTYERLANYLQFSDISGDISIEYQGVKLPPLIEIAKICIHKANQLPAVYSVLHGDLCFSNILFDSRSLQIKVIDPRGLNIRGEFDIYGDQKYDIAKLTHSIIGMYDHIIAGRYVLNEINNYTEIKFDVDDNIIEIQDAYMGLNLVEGISVKDIIPIVVLLFLSMLPLHADRPDRQRAMLVNAIRLYKEFVV